METILAQTVTDWELIICDSYSDDGSWEFFQKYKGDPRIRLYQVPREGIYAGWNECLRRATGEYIYIATSDDTMRPDCLARLIATLERCPEIAIARCRPEIIDHNSKPVAGYTRPWDAFLGELRERPSIWNGKTEFLLHAAFATTIWISITTILFRRELLERTGPFRTDLGSGADEEWMLRACLASDIAFVPEKLATWRVHATQATGKANPLRIAQIILEALAHVLDDPKAGIPAAWQTVNGWRGHILKARHWEYLDAFNLYRSEAKRSPSQFLRNAWAALRAEPRWLFMQSLRGFSRPRECQVDHRGIARELIRLFNSPWPPTPIPYRSGGFHTADF